jgi:hypothetical protein
MRRTDALITQARLISRNILNSDGTSSISSEEILQYLNDGQDRMQNLICARKNIAKIFVKQEIIATVANQEAYSLSRRLLLNKQIENVEFSSDGTLGNYVRLEKINIMNRDSNTTTYPWGYYKQGGQIFLQPIPASSSGYIRVTCEADLDDLEIPRGVISAIGSGTATQFATLTVDATADAYETTTPGWNTQQYCSIVSPLGVRKCYNILISTYVANLITPSPTPFIYDTSLDSQIAVGDVAVFNKFSTTFSQLPDACERYLIQYAATQLIGIDSSNDYSKFNEKLAEIEDDTLRALSSQTSEIQFIPQVNRYEWW